MRDLLERLSDVATGAAKNYEKPANLVEEVKEILEHLAEDELPAASAIFLAKVSANKHFFYFHPRRERDLDFSPHTRPPLLPTSTPHETFRRRPHTPRFTHSTIRDAYVPDKGRH